MKHDAPDNGCQFAHPAPPTSLTGEGFYCRLPGGRVHLPSPDEMQRFCAAGRHHECPVNQRWTARALKPA